MHSPGRICPVCGSDQLTKRFHTERFSFESGGVAYPVTAAFPTYSCGNCGEQFVSDDGEEARHAAICQAMNRLTPAQIVQLREKLSLSRKAFAELAGFGEASLARWETGIQIQSESNDNLLRLLTNDKNVEELAQHTGVGVTARRRQGTTGLNVRKGEPVSARQAVSVEMFPALIPEELMRTCMQGERFQLWKVG